MQRRDVLRNAGLLGAAGLTLPLTHTAEATAMPVDDSATSAAMQELQTLIASKNQSMVTDPAWRLMDVDAKAEGRMNLMHMMNHALDVWLGADPARPAFRRWHYPDKKLLGDNPDALYYDAIIDGAHAYRIRGKFAGATYTSFTVELDRSKGTLGQLGATLNDNELKTDADGNFEIIASANKADAGDNPNWLRLDANAISITTRHYFEWKHYAAADPMLDIPLSIEPLQNPGPAPRPTDASIAAAIRRVTRWIDTNLMPPQPQANLPWVSQVPNEFRPPVKDASNESVGYAAKDNVYAMAPFFLKPDEALIIRGRFPRCRFANVVIWNQMMQTPDYRYRSVSLNRAQTVLEKDGSFTMILAHQNPGRPNWLDTEGRPFGLLFWRFLLPEEAITALETEVVPFSSL